jgi:hypothetical protein
MATGVGERTTAAPQPPPQHAVLPAWRHAIELGPVLTGIVYAAGTLTSMFRVPLLPWPWPRLLPQERRPSLRC